LRDILSSPGTRGIKNMLSACMLRQKFILNNIANEKTPGYVAKDLDFKSFLQASRSRVSLGGFHYSDENQLSPTTNDNISPFRMNGQLTRLFVRTRESGVEEEMVNLAENSLTYRAAADLLSRKYRLINTAITGGK